MPDTHSCPGGCGKQVARSMLACRADWARLPEELRSAVWSAYGTRVRDPRRHSLAIRDALRWYIDNPREVAPDA